MSQLKSENMEVIGKSGHTSVSQGLSPNTFEKTQSPRVTGEDNTEETTPIKNIKNWPLRFDKTEMPKEVKTFLDTIKSRTEGCDVELVAENKKLPTHKALLLGYSTYFKNKLSSVKTGKAKAVDLPRVTLDVSSSRLTLLLDCLYNKNLSLTLEEAKELIGVTTKLKIEYISKKCIEVICETLCIDNCLDTLFLASRSLNRKFIEIVDDYIEKNLKPLLKTKTFLQLPLEKMASLIDRKNPALSQDVVSQLIDGWLAFDDRRSDYKLFTQLKTLELFRNEDKRKNSIFDQKPADFKLQTSEKTLPGWIFLSSLITPNAAENAMKAIPEVKTTKKNQFGEDIKVKLLDEAPPPPELYASDPRKRKRPNNDDATTKNANKTFVELNFGNSVSSLPKIPKRPRKSVTIETQTDVEMNSSGDSLNDSFGQNRSFGSSNNNSNNSNRNNNSSTWGSNGNNNSGNQSGSAWGNNPSARGRGNSENRGGSGSFRGGFRTSNTNSYNNNSSWNSNESMPSKPMETDEENWDDDPAPSNNSSFKTPQPPPVNVTQNKNTNDDDDNWDDDPAPAAQKSSQSTPVASNSKPNQQSSANDEWEEETTTTSSWGSNTATNSWSAGNNGSSTSSSFSSDRGRGRGGRGGGGSGRGNHNNQSGSSWGNNNESSSSSWGDDAGGSKTATSSSWGGGNSNTDSSNNDSWGGGNSSSSSWNSSSNDRGRGGGRGGRGGGDRGRGSRGGGASFQRESRPGDWDCSECGVKGNFAKKTECFKCHAPRPAGVGGGGSSFRGGNSGGGRGAREPRPGDWNCTSCGFSGNFSFKTECYKCNEPKPAGLGDTPSRGGGSFRGRGRGRGDGGSSWGGSARSNDNSGGWGSSNNNNSSSGGWGGSTTTSQPVVEEEDDWDAPMPTVAKPVTPVTKPVADEDDWSSPPTSKPSTAVLSNTNNQNKATVDDEDGWESPGTSTKVAISNPPASNNTAPIQTKSHVSDSDGWETPSVPRQSSNFDTGTTTSNVKTMPPASMSSNNNNPPNESKVSAPPPNRDGDSWNNNTVQQSGPIKAEAGTRTSVIINKPPPPPPIVVDIADDEDLWE